MNALGFLRDTRAGATAIAAAAVTVMTVGGAALIGDHAWLVDQRDVLKAATDAATVATTIEMTRQLGRQPRMTDDALRAALEPVARRYVELNLEHLPASRLATAKETLVVTVAFDRNLGTVDVSAEANLGGTLFSRHMALLGNHAGPETLRADSEVECTTNVVEGVLTLDITASMNNIIEDNPGDADDKNRLAVAIEAADALVDVLHSGCKQADLAIGVVPWDKAVRLDTPGTWQSNGWVDLSRYADDANVTESDWAGCVEDRTHDLADIARSDGLSLALPGTVAFPAFLHPDTTRQDPAIITRMRELVFNQFPDIANTFTAEEVETRLVAYGDNNWASPANGEGYVMANAPVLIAQADGHFEAQGLDVTLESFTSGPLIRKGLSESTLDMAYIGVPPIVHWVAKGAELVIVAKVNYGQATLLARRDAGIKQVSDLTGRRLAGVRERSGMDVLMRGYVLGEVGGLDPEDLTAIETMPVAEMGPALEAGRFDAAFMWEPFVAQILLRRTARVVLNVNRAEPYYPWYVIAARREFVDAHPERVKSVLRAQRLSIKHLRSSPNAGNSVGAEAFKLKQETGPDGKVYSPEEIVKRARSRLGWEWDLNEDDRDFIERLMGWSASLGFIKAPLDLDSLLDLGPLRRVRRELR